MAFPYYVSPEQMMQDKAEYAKKGIAKGRSIVVLEYRDGVLLVADNPSASLNKISEIYDSIAFAGAGKYSEFENLRKAGIRHADLKGYLYSRDDVTAKSLANAYSQTMGTIFSQELKPLEVEILVVGLGANGRSNELYRIAFDGSITDEHGYSVIGGKADALKAHLKDRHRGELGLAQALGLAREAIEAVAAQPTTPSPSALEVAVLDRTRPARKFRRLSAGEVAEALGA